MLIDWFTVGAQLLNFLILVWLLKRFLYKPVRSAIDARERRIAGELANAASKLTDAQKEHDEFDRKNQAFDAERGALLAKATQQGKDERARLLELARKEADELRVTYASALAADRTLLARQVSRLAQREVFAIARRTLADLASANLEEQMGELFTRRLGAMNVKAKGLLAAALRDSPEPALLRTGFDLPAAQRATLQNALNVAFSADVRVRFVTVPDAVCGIELSANGQKLSWTIGDYLKTLERQLSALVDREGAAGLAAAAATATPPAPATPAPAAPAPAAAAPAPVAAAPAAPTPAATARAVAS
jgi:F-type H+-transporting ATPase subunit b